MSQDGVDPAASDAKNEPSLEITYGNREGKYFTQWRFDELKELAEELAEVLPDAKGWRVWYDAYHDFHRLEFTVGEDAYAVRYYKVFAVSKNGNESYDGTMLESLNFGRRSFDIKRFFKNRKHLLWGSVEQKLLFN